MHNLRSKVMYRKISLSTWFFNVLEVRRVYQPKQKSQVSYIYVLKFYLEKKNQKRRMCSLTYVIFYFLYYALTKHLD